MGNKQSNGKKASVKRQTVSIRCDYCGHRNNRSKSSSKKPCVRCAGPAVLPPAPVLEEEGAEDSQQTRSSTTATFTSADGQRRALLPLQHMNLLPFEDTFPIDKPVMFEAQLLESYLKPWFKNAAHLDSKQPVIYKRGDRLQVNGVDFKIMCCKPPEGAFSPEVTRVRCLGTPLSASTELARVHVLPTLEIKTRTRSRQVAMSEIQVYFQDQNRHVTEGQTFLHNGTQYVVISCSPKRGGFVSESTVLATNGNPIADLTKVHLLPMSESLPNREKNISSKALFRKYVAPYFTGRQYYLSQGSQIEIDGIDFRVIAAEPPQGLVTLQTECFTEGEPLSYVDIKRTQMQDDAALARQLQTEENGDPTSAANNQAVFRSQRQHGSTESKAQQIAAQREVLNKVYQLLQIMPESDPHHQALARLAANFAKPPQEQVSLAEVLQTIPDRRVMHNVMRLIKAAAANAAPPASPQRNRNRSNTPQQQQQKPTGTPARVLDSLPTRKWVPRTITKNTDPTTYTCMICLEEYLAEENLRTLPCFHSYHVQCIDTWLQEHTTCCVCKFKVC